MPPDVSSIRIDPAIFNRTLENKLADLPPLPAVVACIMQTVNHPDTSAEELNRLISMDQGLASKVLRIVNSGYYGFPRRISTVTNAILILGCDTVCNLVLGVAAFGLLSHKSMPYGLNRAQFWEHAVAAGIAGSLLAQKRLPKVRAAAEEAFIGGLLHDVGALYLDTYFPVQYAVAMAFATREGKTARDAEALVLGIDHATVGRRIGEHWNFPTPLVAIMGGHHEPMQHKATSELVLIVHAAEWLAWECGHKTSEHTRACPLDPNVAEWLAFDEAAWTSLKRELATQFAAAEGLLKSGGVGCRG